MRETDYSSLNISIPIHFSVKYIISGLGPFIKTEDSDYFYISCQRHFKYFFESLLKPVAKMGSFCKTS